MILRTCGLAAMAMAAGTLMAPTYASPGTPPLGASLRQGGFSIQGVRADAYPMVPSAGQLRALDGVSGQPQSPRNLVAKVREVPGLGPALVDDSLSRRGFATAATSSVVELSWLAPSPTTTYLVLRDGHVIARVRGVTGHFSDKTVKPLHSYSYSVSPAPGSMAQESWGTEVTVPAGGTTAAARLAGLQTAAVAMAAKLVATTTTTLTWVAFIPQKFVGAPPVGCDYGTKYEFGGDGHGFNWKSSKYRVALNALIDWGKKTIASYPSVHASHVYRKSTGALVATKTASSSGLKARYAGHGTYDVEVSMQLTARNPFCSVGEIDGGLLVDISQTGTWAILSGSVKPMPDHLVYIWNNGSETTVWRGLEKSDWCLAGEGLCGDYRPTGAGTFK